MNITAIVIKPGCSKREHGCLRIRRKTLVTDGIKYKPASALIK